MKVQSLDHLVLTVADPRRTLDFYARVLGMEPFVFGEGRRALHFGPQKINLHEVGREIRPHARAATAGSADLCFVVDTPVEGGLAHLEQEGVEVELGPVDRTGARGPIRSVYVRDPDGNLVELSSYRTPLE